MKIYITILLVFAIIRYTSALAKENNFSSENLAAFLVVVAMEVVGIIGVWNL